MTFNNGSLIIDTIPTYMWGYEFPHNNSAFSTFEGDLFAFFNGIQIQNRQFQAIENGDGLSEEVEKYYYYMSHPLLPQGSVFVPFPGKSDSVILFYASQRYLLESNGAILDICSADISGAIISRSANNGFGQTLERQLRIIKKDTLIGGAVTLCRHANGRDWWLLSFKRNSTQYHRFLIDPNGIHHLGLAVIDFPIINGFPAACFSPDGTKFAIYNAVTFLSDGGHLHLFDFNRCTGFLSNQIQINMWGNYGGLAFSPNSHYLYHNKRDTAFQYDLWASDIPASRKAIAIYDGFQAPFPTSLYMLQSAPDGKIYGSATNGTQYLHVIQNPDEAWPDCQYQQHAVRLLKYNDFSLPNFPYYRLGPLDGSPCDTLGLNNDPKAWYRYEQDTLDPLAVEFRDLSYYEPATWTWDFGDGSPASNQRHPQHQYAQPGAYHVCLTVSNQYGSNTHCKTLYLGVTAQDNPVLQAQVLVWPNPFRERFAVALSANLRSPALRLYDAAGRLVLEQRLVFGVNEIETAGLPAGLYVWEVTAGGERVKSGKCVKLAE
ncbi:MAG: PKD domain-containing protein [Saprospiraceae bacterium]